jgi:hypothetical protein
VTGGGGGSTGGGGGGSTGGGGGSTGGGGGSTGGGGGSTGGGGGSTGGGGGSTGGGGGSTGGGGGSTGGGGGSTGGGGGSTGGGGGSLMPSQQIDAARQWAAGTLSLTQAPISNVLVTGLRPLVTGAAASDPAGFFVQADQAGPAIFVAVDPATLSPAPTKGDRVGFTANSVGHVGTNVNDPYAVTSLSGFSRTSTGGSVSSLVQDISSVDFSSSSTTDAYESELITVTGTLATGLGSGGAGYQLAVLSSAGTTSTSGGLRLRLPNDFAATQGLSANCSVRVSAPLWRYGVSAQASAFTTAELTVLSCPPPQVIGASAVSASSITVAFDHDLSASSVSLSDFSASGLSLQAATLSSPRVVTLTTSTQSPGTSYSISISGVADLRGVPVASGTTVEALGYGSASGCWPDVVISQFYPGGGGSSSQWNLRYVELYNRSSVSVDLSGYTLQYSSATNTTTSSWAWAALSGVLPPNSYHLVGLGPTGTTGQGLVVDELFSTFPSIAPAGGKLALVRGTAPLAGACPPVPGDLVGYGSTANCSVGAPAVTAGTQALVRGGAGCQESGNNFNDFTATTPVPRSSSTAASACTCP